jgi:phage terminase large subunit-like protein
MRAQTFTFKIYNTLTQLWFSRKRTIYVGIVRCRSTRKDVIAEFTPLGSLVVQPNKRGVIMVF